MNGIDLRKYAYPVRLAAHAVGLDRRNPYTRHGKRFYKPYRNGYATNLYSEDWKHWRAMEEQKMACGSPSPGGTMTVFCLTRKGLDWLGDQLGMTIHDEER